MILLTGGSACGKSTFAESLAMEFGQPLVYVATMRPFGEESLVRIARHREMRATKGFITVERQVDIAGLEPDPTSTVLLECISNLMSNEMFDDEGGMRDVEDVVVDGVVALASRCANLIVVTNEVGTEPLEGYGEGTIAYVHAIGRVNMRLAAMSDCVCELICGIPLVIKGELP